MESEHTPPIGAPLPQAIELVVNSGGDVVDPGDGVLTLREAIADQQQAAGVSAHITFATGISEVVLTQGELLIGGGPTTAGEATLTIDGGTGGVTISQSGPSTAHNGRVLHIDGTDGAAPQVALDNLVFSGGSVQSYVIGQPSQIGYGGGLLAENATLALTDVTVRGNRADLLYGGKLGGGGVALVGCTTTITGGSIEDNTVAGPSGAVAVGGLGGGILAVNGSLILSGTNVAGNSCTSIGGANGGGIGLNGTDTTLDHVTVERNTAGSVNNPSGYNNFASGGGGVAAYGGGDLTVSYSTVGANYVYGPGASGGGIAAGGRLTVEHSLLTDNRAKGSTLALGGGIYMRGGALALSDSTVEGNKLYTAGQGSGGGINVRNGSASIISATIVGNTGSTGTLRHRRRRPRGGGRRHPHPQQHHRRQHGHVADVRGYIASDGHNLFSQGGIDGQQPGDIVTSSPGIAPLAANGGPTQTMALLPGSPALDAGLDGDAVSTTDQRGTGFERISGAHTDIGAFETQQAGGVERLFTPGDDTVDLRGVDLELLPGALGTQALAGNDTIHLSTTQNRGELFRAGTGDDVVIGGSAGDRIAGEAGDDLLVGGGQADVLRGGPGNDVLHGRRGLDELHGGADADRFVYSDFRHAPHGTVGFDEIAGLLPPRGRPDRPARDRRRAEGGGRPALHLRRPRPARRGGRPARRGLGRRRLPRQRPARPRPLARILHPGSHRGRPWGASSRATSCCRRRAPIRIDRSLALERHFALRFGSVRRILAAWVIVMLVDQAQRRRRP